MAIFTKQELDRIGLQARASKFSYKSADTILKEAAEDFDPAKTYDIFLSHSYKDKDTIIGMREFLLGLGYSVYVDWIDDAQLDRSKVTKQTAKLLRERMMNCRSLFFATSENSSGSIWMPWELGYFDGIKQKAAILPITERTVTTNNFVGQEYLGVYPYVTKGLDRSDKLRLWIQLSEIIYVTYDAWLAGTEPYRH